jgi:hypothetical protein
MNKATSSVKSASTTKSRKVKVASTTEASVVETPVVETPVVETPVVETPVVETPVVEAPVTTEATADATFSQRLEALITSRTEMVATLKREITELRKLQRDHNNMMKEATKKVKKTKAPRDFTKPKRATGFAEPVLVSSELYSFLVKNKATMKDHTFVPSSEADEAAWPRLPVVSGVPVARTDVTSFISKYIKDHNLQNPEMKREIIPDASLKKIFANPNEPTPATYSYLQLQKYISHHFPKKTQ